MAKQDTKTETGRPVKALPLRFTWYAGQWKRLFDRQISLIKDDVKRAKVQDKLIIYLSCPVSSRGGGYSGTNVDIALHTERVLLEKWGERLWVLNPARYQLESKEGTGLLERYARDENIDLAALRRVAEPRGGDYMRMWTRVLVEDDKDDTAQYFDAFYFLGPRDVHDFFVHGGLATLTAGIELYFARRAAMDPGFLRYFSPIKSATSGTAAMTGRSLRNDFVRFYAVRASAHFSLGSHDEWEIFRLVNKERLRRTSGDVGRQLAGFFDGVQIPPSAAEMAVTPGYSVPK
jgi:hypothetical protein